MSNASFLRNTTVELADGLGGAISSVSRCVIRGVIAARPGSPIWAAAFISASLTVLYEYVYCSVDRSRGRFGIHD